MGWDTRPLSDNYIPERIVPMNLSRKLKRTFPLACDFAVATRHFVQRLGRRHPSQNWAIDRPVMNDRAGLSDMPTGMFLRLILENGYREVTEIGTYTGARISTLKRLVPSLNAHGMDIGPHYQTPFESHGVDFRPYDSTFFEGGMDRPLLVCVQTLVCFEEEEVNRLFAACAKGGVDMAFFEVQPLFELGDAAPVNRIKTGGTGWYHDYGALMRRHGFSDQLTGINKAWSHTGHTKTLEHFRPFFASAPKSSGAD
jgi:hypothetical protein